jgi:hypothetical protein
MRNAYKSLVRKPEQKKSCGRLRCNCVDNIKIYSNKMEYVPVRRDEFVVLNYSITTIPLKDQW